MLHRLFFLRASLGSPMNSNTSTSLPSWFPLGLQFNIAQLANLLLVATLSLLLLRRLIKSIHRQRRMALDVKQAQEVQQVILPEEHTLLPGFEIESEYRPALLVGGDFFPGDS